MARSGGRSRDRDHPSAGLGGEQTGPTGAVGDDEPSGRLLRALAVLLLAGLAFALLVWFGAAGVSPAVLAAVLPADAVVILSRAVAAGSLASPAASSLVDALAGHLLAARSEWSAAVPAIEGDAYMYGVSTLAAAWLWLRAVRDWTLDVRALRLRPRAREGDDA